MSKQLCGRRNSPAEPPAEIGVEHRHEAKRLALSPQPSALSPRLSALSFELSAVPNSFRIRPSAQKHVSPLKCAFPYKNVSLLESAFTAKGVGVPTAKLFQSPQPESRLPGESSTHLRAAPRSWKAAPPRYPRRPAPTA